MLVKVSDLKPGNKFIWADQRTRDHMIANEKRRCQVLEFIEHRPRDSFVFQDPYDRPEGDRATKSGDNLLPGQRQFCYRDDSYVYLITDDGERIRQREFSYEMNCVRCASTYGNHMGVFCPSGHHGTNIFMPDQQCAKPVDDNWFAELGL